ncbi:hypothetical protein ACHAAC_16755 [Aeromicrobium sp. CF4.19]|uniref:hypothetical protein n=1 Tax=Aeromicrobium sp. CF4.19 TaxID=3373082 RepID=UPI003EE4C6C5
MVTVDQGPSDQSVLELVRAFTAAQDQSTFVLRRYLVPSLDDKPRDRFLDRLTKRITDEDRVDYVKDVAAAVGYDRMGNVKAAYMRAKRYRDAAVHGGNGWDAVLSYGDEGTFVQGFPRKAQPSRPLVNQTFHDLSDDCTWIVAHLNQLLARVLEPGRLLDVSGQPILPTEDVPVLPPSGLD